MRKWSFVGIILLSGLAAAATVEDLPTNAAKVVPLSVGSMAATVDRVVAEWLASTGAPSVSIAIVQDGRLAYAKAYGAARLNPKVPSTAATRYAIDSVSKEFTAAAVLLLAEQRKLSLDDPMDKWFPELRAAAAVTLRQLLTHTSGIRDYWPQDFLTPEMTRPTTTGAIIDEWAQRPLDFEPGTDWQYSNTGYVLAGAHGRERAVFLRRKSLFNGNGAGGFAVELEPAGSGALDRA